MADDRRIISEAATIIGSTMLTAILIGPAIHYDKIEHRKPQAEKQVTTAIQKPYKIPLNEDFNPETSQFTINAKSFCYNNNGPVYEPGSKKLSKHTVCLNIEPELFAQEIEEYR